MRAREELAELLRAHDPETAAAAGERIGPQHLLLLRQMATDPGLGASEPGVRRQAIAALVRLTDGTSLNVLSDLAQFDPDPTVRGAALVGLGMAGVRLATSVLVSALHSSDPLEVAASARAIRVLAGKIGDAAIWASLEKSDRSMREHVSAALKEPVLRRRTRAQSRADDTPLDSRG